ncbi:hypothetical protein TNCT_580081 [Trichonephila clavata]|uniref:Uncharacterized protein n=1 Tax=Trichonephila clavata TaxID=2740835 RepID=A0A8X6G4H4_TRICU|nr:hypothetical protein TNCT_580081 [Trichonephila clavata]
MYIRVCKGLCAHPISILSLAAHSCCHECMSRLTSEQMNHFTNQDLKNMHLAYEAAELGKFTKTDVLTEEFHSTKCLHVYLVISVNIRSMSSNMHDMGRRQLTWTGKV